MVASSYATNEVSRATSSIPASIRSGTNRDANAARPNSENGMIQKQTYDSGVFVSRSEALRSTIDGITADTVMAANVATQIQVSVLAIRPNSSVLTTSAGCSAAANSRANGLPISMLISATRKIPALLSG